MVTQNYAGYANGIIKKLVTTLPNSEGKYLGRRPRCFRVTKICYVWGRTAVPDKRVVGPGGYHGELTDFGSNIVVVEKAITGKR